VRIVYYSHSGQTKRLVGAAAEGFGAAGLRVEVIHLDTSPHLPFPFPNLPYTFWMMTSTLFRVRLPLAPVVIPTGRAHLVVLAGPTWSFNPSGPILSFLDRHGRQMLEGADVLPLISCRGYWRNHWRVLRGMIRRAGGRSLDPWVVTHPQSEPWRSLGVFLSLMGRRPWRFPVMRRRYPRFGHSGEQVAALRALAREKGAALLSPRPVGP
jgi:hypothetical protein